jgi:xylan 1,4-beta-xylosidase
MLWNYHDAEKASPSTPAAVTVTGLPKSVSRVRLTHYRIDDTHSNAYTVWKAMGSPQNPSAAQIAELKSKDGLQLLESPRWIDVKNDAMAVSTDMPHHSISLLQLDW